MPKYGPTIGMASEKEISTAAPNQETISPNNHEGMDSTHFLITSHKLNEKNFLQPSQPSTVIGTGLLLKKVIFSTP